MAPTTRQTNRSTPSPRAFGAWEHNIPKKICFFDAYDERFPAENLKSITDDIQLSLATCKARRWAQLLYKQS